MCERALDCDCTAVNIEDFCFINEEDNCPVQCGVLDGKGRCSGSDIDFALSNNARRVPDSECVCASGYWGPKCNKRCPGVNADGSGVACGGSGTCNVETGSCQCA